ncbi:MAG: hypothetical protein ALECFALPRED_006973 [Alectoria fallacina]|uniref:DUF7730 domain-containing protein n=1 Tax=Alectoria fallacina TaxID=1903189 RepID=A0A8H3G8I5_9LECA|nr:MAG: hypothetical protein ALECFALPRED_006973 [Alectoria fallacina]
MTKRTLPAVTGQTQPPAARKKQAVTVTRSAATKAILQRNASTSPLLKLPGEIRETIFSLVVGHQLIHLLYLRSRGKFRHTVCTAAASEDEAYNEFMTGHTRISSNHSAHFHSVTFKERHVHCKSWDFENQRFFNGKYDRLSGPMTTEERRKPMLDLSLLGACRQMYEEGNVLLWTTNTFSFEDSMPLRMFIDGLHSTQRKKLTRMHIDFAWDPFSAHGWQQLLRPPLLSKINGLRIFHATFDHYLGNYYVDDRLSPPFSEPDFELCILKPLSRMQILPLKHVTVVVGDHIRDTYPQEKDRWTITQKREVAEGLRTKLLDPNGHKI